MTSPKDLGGRFAATRSIRILLSGPIGGGKSTVGRLLAERGVTVIEADRIGHRVLEPDGEAFAAVAMRWPAVVRDGRIDRSALAAVVFADPAELAALEALTHPHIARRIVETARSVDGVVAVELPLAADIVGEGWHRLVVMADEDLRIQRAVARGMDPDDVRRRVAAQPTAEEWLEVADSVIVNDGDLEALQERVDAWCRQTIGAEAG